MNSAIKRILVLYQHSSKRPSNPNILFAQRTERRFIWFVESGSWETVTVEKDIVRLDC